MGDDNCRVYGNKILTIQPLFMLRVVGLFVLTLAVKKTMIELQSTRKEKRSKTVHWSEAIQTETASEVDELDSSTDESTAVPTPKYSFDKLLHGEKEEQEKSFYNFRHLTKYEFS